MRRYRAICGSIALCFMIVVVSCSSPEKVVAPGSTYNDEYTFFRQDINDFLHDLVGYITQDITAPVSFAPLELTPPGMGRLAYGAPPSIVADTTFDTTYQNGWHIVTGTIQSETETIAISDSLRFLDGDGLPQQVVDEATTAAVEFREHLRVTIAVSEFEMIITMADDVAFSFTGLQSPVITVDGRGDFEMGFTGVNEYGPVGLNLAYAVEFEDVTVGNPEKGGSGCIESGVLAITFDGSSYEYDENGVRLTDGLAAQITVTFTGGQSAVYAVTAGESRFTESVDACGP